MGQLPDVQFSLRPGIIELRWGDPAPELLPVAELSQAAAWTLEHDGPNALNYGAEQGPGALIEPLCDWLAAHGDPVTSPEHVFITGGVSQGLDLLCTLFTRPGNAVLVESPVYHLALRVFRDHGLELVPVAGDSEGLRPDALKDALAGGQRAGRQPAFLYTVSTFNNPTGAIMPESRRRAVVKLAREAGVTILEDDVYRHLWYDVPPPPPLQAFASDGNVIRLGSFSKILAPGLRVGWLYASPEIVRRCAGSGLLDSGGGQSHFAAHVAAAFIRLGLLDEHLARLRQAYAGRRDALLAALEASMPSTCSWSRPGGGFFVWVRLPEGINSMKLLLLAEKEGVSFAPGPRFCSGGGGESHLRLAFSLLPEAELAEGAKRLARAISRT
jgi:2-aminoadipate transaminase